METIKVTQCNDCPFYDMEYMTCTREPEKYNTWPIPEWCPLKFSSIIVELSDDK